MIAAAATCETCAYAARRARETHCTVICECGRSYRSRKVFHAVPGDESAAPSPLARAAHEAAARSTPDAELTRVRVLLADLRPDHADPWEPAPKPEDGPALTIRVRDPQAAWGGIPRGLASPMGAQLAAAEAASRCAADVLREISALRPDAAAVLRWLRREASLGQGLRGLWCDVGMAFASAAQTAAWEDLTVRRGFAPAHGRRLVLAAATAWEGRAR